LGERGDLLSGGLPGVAERAAVALMTTLRERRREFALTSGAGLLLLLVGLVLLNLLSNWIYFRVDLTQQRAYSLSSASKKLVRGMDDRVIVKAYFTPDLPTPYNEYSRYVRDLLSEYRAASHGRLRYEFVLTSPPKEFEQRAAEAGLTPIQFQEMGSDQLQIRRGYMGLVLYYRDKSDTIPVIKGVENLEYDITSKLARMVRHQKKTVAFTTGHGEPQWQTPQFKLSQDLSELYDIKQVSLTPGATAPIQADALFVVGPKQPMDPGSLRAIDDAIIRGVPTAFFVDAKNVMLQRFMAVPLDNGLRPFLQHYGIKLGTQLVYDAQCESVTMTQSVGGFPFSMNVPYPYILSVTGFAKDHPITRDLSSVALPFTTTVEVSSAPTSAQFKPLLMSSAQSWLTPANEYRIGPDAIPRPRVDDPHGPYSVGGVWSGRFTSYFQTPVSTGTAQPSGSPSTQILVVGTSEVFNPDLQSFAGNDAFLTNVVAFMSHDETLLGIHSKSQIFRPLKPVKAPIRAAVKIICGIGVSILAALWGLYRWRRRQHERAWIAGLFKPHEPDSR